MHFGQSNTASYHCRSIYLSPFWNIHGCLAGWWVSLLVPPLLVKPHHHYLLSHTTSTCFHRSWLEQSCCDGAVQAFYSGRLPCRVPRQLPGDREILGRRRNGTGGSRVPSLRSSYRSLFEVQLVEAASSKPKTALKPFERASLTGLMAALLIPVTAEPYFASLIASISANFLAKTIKKSCHSKSWRPDGSPNPVCS